MFPEPDEGHGPRTVPEELRGEERAAGRHEGPPRIIDVAAERYPECLEVLHSAFATEVADHGITRENTPSNPAFWDLDFLTRLVAKPTQLFAIESGGRLVGCAFLGTSRRRSDAAILRHLAVVPDARHRGHGEALVGEAARRGRASGAAVLRIGIVAANVRLSDWYHRLGFVTVETVRYPGLVFTVDHLELEL